MCNGKTRPFLHRAALNALCLSTLLLVWLSWLSLLSAEEPVTAIDSREAVWEELLLQVRTLGDQERYTEAENVAEEAVRMAESIFGPTHLDTAYSLNMLASLSAAQGKFSETESLCRRALAIQEQGLKPNDPAIAYSQHLLAVAYHEQGKYAEAERFYKRALAAREKTLGPEAPETVSSLERLVLLYLDRGENSKAKRPLQRILAIQEKTLGHEDPDTDMTRRALKSIDSTEKASWSRKREEFKEWAERQLLRR